MFDLIGFEENIEGREGWNVPVCDDWELVRCQGKDARVHNVRLSPAVGHLRRLGVGQASEDLLSTSLSTICLNGTPTFIILCQRSWAIEVIPLRPDHGGNTMSAVKAEVLQLIKQMPDDATLDDILAELYFKLQVDAGLKELDEGQGIPHQEVKDRIAKWLSR